MLTISQKEFTKLNVTIAIAFLNMKVLRKVWLSVNAYIAINKTSLPEEKKFLWELIYGRYYRCRLYAYKTVCKNFEIKNLDEQPD